MGQSSRRLILRLAVLFVAILPKGMASEISRSAAGHLPAQLSAEQAMPTPEALELEQAGVRYQLTILQGAVQVTCCHGSRPVTSVRVRMDAAANPELLDARARWVLAPGEEWRLISVPGTLALTAEAGESGAAPSDIVLSFEGARSLSLDALGNLLIVTDAGDLHQQRPAVFNANAAPVASRYVLLGGNRVAVEIQTQHANVVGDMDGMWSSGLEFGYGH